MLLADGVNRSPARRLGDADKNAAKERAGHRAQSAGNDDNEREERVARPKHRGRVNEQSEHGAGSADACCAETEGERVEALHVEADDLRAGEIIGAGADRLADKSKTKEDEQRRGERDRGQAGVDFRSVDNQRADLDAVERVGGLHRASVRAEDDQEAVGDDEPESHQQQELRVLGPPDKGVDQADLQNVAKHEHHRGDRHQQDQRIKVKRGEQDHRDEHSDCHHLAVGEINDPHHPENDRKPERQQAVNKPGQNPADNDVEIDVESH